MSIAGIFTPPYASTSYGSSFPSSNVQSQNPNIQQFQTSFSQLGQDLQSGNLSAAEQDFASLQQVNPQNSSTSSKSNNPITQAFQQLQVDLQSGNLSGAQQAYNNIEQDSQTQNQTGQSGQSEGIHHHRHGGGVNPLLQDVQQTQSSSSSSGSSATQMPYSFLTQLPYAQPLGQSSSASSLSFTA